MRFDIILEFLLFLAVCKAGHIPTESTRPQTIGRLSARGISSKDKNERKTIAGQQTAARHRSPSKSPDQPSAPALNQSSARNTKSRRKPQRPPPPQLPGPPRSPSPPASPDPELSTLREKPKAGRPLGRKRKKASSDDSYEPAHKPKIKVEEDRYGLRSSLTSTPKQKDDADRSSAKGSKNTQQEAPKSAAPAARRLKAANIPIPQEASKSAATATKQSKAVDVPVTRERPWQQPIRAMPRSEPPYPEIKKQGLAQSPAWRHFREQEKMHLSHTQQEKIQLSHSQQAFGMRMGSFPKSGPLIIPSALPPAKLPTPQPLDLFPKFPKLPSANAFRASAQPAQMLQMIPTPGLPPRATQLTLPQLGSSSHPALPLVTPFTPRTGSGMGLMRLGGQHLDLAKEHELAFQELKPLLAKLEVEKARNGGMIPPRHGRYQ